MYLDEQLHKDLVALARQHKTTMADMARRLLRKAVKQQKKKQVDTSGIKTLLAIANLGMRGGDDPYLSENIDHYLYGAPKRKK